MRFSLPKVRLSFQAKVLIPMLAMMVFLTQFTAWLVDSRITAQLKADAADKLAAAETVFQNFDKINARNLLLRYRNYLNEPRVKAVVQLSDAKTTRHLFSEFLQEEPDVAVMLFTAKNERPLAFVPRDPSLDLVEFESQSISAVRRALGGEATVDLAAAGDTLFHLVCIPVLVGNQLKGALTFGVELGSAMARELKQLTHTEIVFLAGDRVVASTLSENARRRLPNLLTARSQETVINGEHYL